jgi:hypothetical protein
MNFDIFFPIQIWEYKDPKHPSRSLFRLQAPNLISPSTQYQFPLHFIDNYSNVSPHYKTSWKLQRTIWVINPKYSASFVHGYTSLYVQQKNSEPYNTEFISESVFQHISEIGMYETFTFSYLVYETNSPKTMLLYMNLSITNRLQDIVCVDENGERDITNNKYNFLPFKKNKDVPFYEIRTIDKNLYLYVFPERPEGNYWYMNPSHICLPTASSSGFTTCFECFQESSKSRDETLSTNDTFFSIYLQDPLLHLSSIMNHPNLPLKQETTSKNIFIGIAFVSLILLLLLLLYLTIPRRVYHKQNTIQLDSIQ